MKDFPEFLVALFTDKGTKSRYFLSFWKLKNCFRNQFVSSVATDSKDVLVLKLEKVAPTEAQLFQLLKLCLQKITQKILCLASVMKFVLHLFRNNAGALCVWLKAFTK